MEFRRYLLRLSWTTMLICSSTPDAPACVHYAYQHAQTERDLCCFGTCLTQKHKYPFSLRFGYFTFAESLMGRHDVLGRRKETIFIQCYPLTSGHCCWAQRWWQQCQGLPVGRGAPHQLGPAGLVLTGSAYAWDIL
eukprot:scaffold19996_cov30-Tisochrysis_lutea.AAC.1